MALWAHRGALTLSLSLSQSFSISLQCCTINGQPNGFQQNCSRQNCNQPNDSWPNGSWSKMAVGQMAISQTMVSQMRLVSWWFAKNCQLNNNRPNDGETNVWELNSTIIGGRSRSTFLFEHDPSGKMMSWGHLFSLSSVRRMIAFTVFCLELGSSLMNINTFYHLVDPRWEAMM